MEYALRYLHATIDIILLTVIAECKHITNKMNLKINGIIIVFLRERLNKDP